MHSGHVFCALAAIALLSLAQSQSQTAPPSLRLQADALIYHANGKRVVAQGNVELHYDNHKMTADKVEYDESANTLVATGNVDFTEPNGNITHSDRLEMLDEFREAFVRSMGIVPDRTRSWHEH